MSETAAPAERRGKGLAKAFASPRADFCLKQTALPCLAAKLGLEGRAVHAAALQTIHASTKGKDHAASLRVSDATKDGIRARNAADARVYDAARRRFARDLSLIHI